MWDLFARRAGVSVRHFLNPDAVDTVCAYASGIDIRQAQPLISAERSRGHRAFKVKVGFAMDDDISMINRIVLGLERGERLFADANQAWHLADALLFAKTVEHTGLGWIEEPLAGDTPLSDWRALAGASAIPLAAGENIAGLDRFSEAIAGAGLSFIQPDLAKWGGISGCLQVAGYAAESGLIYCPHYLGGGIGLCASAHFLAAIGGNGLLEIDTNRNPLRQEIWDPHLDHGKAVLGKMVGLGIEHLSESVLQFTAQHYNMPSRRASGDV
jgi:L-alanine-DL-glutamate epimerase-like enolase superfamily enzyme